MYSQTVEALSRLTSMYVCAIEGTATKIPEEILEQIATDPFKACESLNDFALSCNAITPELDAELEAIYESMDANDAHSDPDPEVCQAALAAYASVHVEITDPEPEPEPESEAVPETEASGDEPAQAEADAEASEKPRKRRQRRQHKATQEDSAETEASQAEPVQQALELDAEQSETESPKKTAKKKCSTKKAEAAEEDAPKETAKKKVSAKQAAQAFEGEVFSVDQALAILGCSRPTLTKLIEAGEIPAFKKGRSWQVSANAVLDMAAKK